MSSRLEDTSAILGEYMLKGWTLTDLHCEDCGTTPLMREPAGQAAREGRPPIQFCAQCDGRPGSGRRAAATASASTSALASSSSSASIYGTPPSTSVDLPEASTPRAVSAAAPAPALAPSPPRPTATARGDPDAAADAIGDLLLKGYSLLQDICPEPTCRGIPLVGYPRRRDGSKDSRRECVSCGQRWVDEKDLKAAGMSVKEKKEEPKSAPVAPAPAPAPAASTATSFDSPFGIIQPAPDAPKLPLAPFSEEPESPRTRARRELYATGSAINAEVSRKRAAEEEAKRKAKEQATGKGKAKEDEASPGYAVPASSTPPPASAPTPKAEPTSILPAPAASSSRQVFVAADHRPEIPDGKLRVVLISTGSVASVKIPNIVSELRADGNVEVQVVSTDSSLHFFDRDAVEAENPGVRVWTDKDEWSDWKQIGDPILHIELRRWADLVVIAPVSADMLAKIAGGICDNLPLSLLRALSPDTPVILCPAMNTFMYSHPLTARHLSFVRSVLKYYILGPQGAGRLACGDVGAGKMTEWKDIVQAILGYAAVFRNRPDGDSSMLEALLSGSVPQLPVEDKIDPTISPRIHETVRPRVVPTFRIQPPTEREREVIHVKHTPKPRQVRPSFTSVLAKVPASLLSYLLFPVLILLHALFTVSSIVLRVLQSRPEPLPELTKPAPPHLGLILVPGKAPRHVVRERYIESVRRAVVWAGEWGVGAISVWDGEGLGVQHHNAVTSSLLDLPLSPPSSTPSSPPLSSSDDLVGTLGNETVTKSVYVNTPSGPRRVEVHFLAPSASDVIAKVTQQYIRDGIAPADINESSLGVAIFTELGIPSDPDLLIIHHLSPPGFWRGLLPRRAPELWGYPAWALRITEIYTHPPTLPFYLPFIGKLLHNSPLPILRKLGASFPDEIDVGVLDTDAWDGAQSSWEKVEQRRGK